MFMWHPNLFTVNYKVEYEHNPENILTYRLNDIMTAMCLFRLFYLFRFLLTITKYKSSRAARACRMYGEQSNYKFSLVCVFNENPFVFLFFILIIFLVFFSYEIRIFEW